MVNIEKFGDFKFIGKQKKKKQIILCHTSREVEEYLTSLKFRYNGNFDRIPNYVVKRNGDVFELINEQSYSNFFNDSDINKNYLIVCL